MSKIMTSILENIENGSIVITKDGFKRVKQNTLSVESMRKRLKLDEGAVRVKTDDFTAEQLLEMKGEKQTYQDLESEVNGQEPLYYPGAEPE